MTEFSVIVVVLRYMFLVVTKCLNNIRLFVSGEIFTNIDADRIKPLFAMSYL